MSYAWALAQMRDRDSLTCLQRFRGAEAPTPAAQLARHLLWHSRQFDSLDARAIAILAIAYIDCGTEPLVVADELDVPLLAERG
jgi:hypothetical protein